MNLENNTASHSPILDIDHPPSSSSSGFASSISTSTSTSLHNCALQTPPSAGSTASTFSTSTSSVDVDVDRLSLSSPRCPCGPSAQPSDDAVRLATQLVKQQRGFQIGHYGLTAATAARDPSVVGAASSRANTLPPVSLAAPPIYRPAHAWKPPEGQGLHLNLHLNLNLNPSLASAADKAHPEKKRSHDPATHDSLRPPAKKPRRLPPGRIDLGHIVPPKTPDELPMPDGVSPLFFSSSKTRPSMTGRPPSFSTAGPSVAMLNRLRDEPNVVRIVKLPKGHMSSASPARANSLSTPGSAGSESLSSRASSDYRQVPAELRELHGLSVLDLLEADDRPTFVIDLSNATNFGPGPLKVLFMNASLRASQGVHELITQSSDHSSEASRFKAWAVSFTRDSRPMDVSLPSLSYGGITWTCATLADRFRFVSGTASAVSITPTSPAPAARASAILEQRARRPTPTREPTPGRERALSDLDYFGDAEPDPALLGGRRAHSEPRDYRDVRPDTPVNEVADVIDVDELHSDLPQTFDWTRIQDASGMYPPPPFSSVGPPVVILGT